ncbi:MAG: NAD(P)/FAD-dependent oxidoreductase [bacterium]
MNNGREEKVWDVVVVGGGPAGMMAAGTAAERGLRVLLLEKNKTLGKKLLITGGGRCNITNNKPDVRALLKKYKKSDQFLFSAFSQFAVKETLEFFKKRGLETKEENDGRLFPASESAQSVWDVLVEYIQKGDVTVTTDAAVVQITRADAPPAGGFSIQLKSGQRVQSKACVVAAGGTSRPETGSTGDGYKWLQKLGHTVEENGTALVPVATKDAWSKKLGGVTLADIKITLEQGGKKQQVQKGKLLFTHFGVSGPTILNMSRDIGELLGYGDVSLSLDLFPHLDHKAVREKLQELLVVESNKKIKNVLAGLGTSVPKALVSSLLELAKIDGETASHSVRTFERAKLVQLLKALPLHVSGLLGADKAVVSSGGVSLEEVDFKTMQSRLVPDLFLVGDTLNIDRPSGGYSLQLCWTTGFVAGSSCLPAHSNLGILKE